MASSMGAAAVRTQHKTLRESLDDVRPKAVKILTTSEPARTVQNSNEKLAFLALIDEARSCACRSRKPLSATANRSPHSRRPAR
jgi:hypothetical protein